jgi:hypothetical protein
VIGLIGTALSDSCDSTFLRSYQPIWSSVNGFCILSLHPLSEHRADHASPAMLEVTQQKCGFLML